VKNYIIIFLCFLSSCTHSNPEWVQLVSAEAVVKPHEDIFIRCLAPDGLQFAKGKIIILNRCGDYPVQIIDLGNAKESWVGSFGDGPNEIGYAVGMLSYDDDPNLLIKVIDQRKQSIIRLMAKDDEYYLEEEKNFPSVISVYKDVIEMEDGSILYNRLQAEYNIGKWLPSGEELFVMDFQPDIGFPDESGFGGWLAEKGMSYYNSLIVNPNTGKLIQVLRMFPYMIAYDNQLQLLKIKQTEGKLPQVDWSLPGSRKFEGLSFLSLEAKAGPDYFYVLNPKLIYNPRSFEESIDPSIDIYNWDMELVASLKLDKLLEYMSIDFKNKKIYGKTFGSEDQVLGEVSIPASLHQFF
jgi:hypothetical protein